MHPDLEQLVPLQEMDVAAQHLREAIAAAPKRVAEATAGSPARPPALATLREQIAKEQALARRLESDIADQRQKLERAQKKVDGATTTAQVTALEHEITFARTEISRLEDSELESMERSEALEAKLPEAEADLSAAQETLDASAGRPPRPLPRAVPELAELDRRREELRASILTSETGEASLSRYDRIAKARGTAISEAVTRQVHCLRHDGSPTVWQDLRDNSADSPSRTDPRHLRELRPNALLRPGSGCSAAQACAGRKHRSFDRPVYSKSRLGQQGRTPRRYVRRLLRTWPTRTGRTQRRPGVRLPTPAFAALRQKVREVEPAVPSARGEVEERLRTPIQVKDRLQPAARPLNCGQPLGGCSCAARERSRVVQQHRVQDVLVVCPTRRVAGVEVARRTFILKHTDQGEAGQSETSRALPGPYESESILSLKDTLAKGVGDALIRRPGAFHLTARRPHRSFLRTAARQA